MRSMNTGRGIIKVCHSMNTGSGIIKVEKYWESVITEWCLWYWCNAVAAALWTSWPISRASGVHFLKWSTRLKAYIKQTEYSGTLLMVSTYSTVNKVNILFATEQLVNLSQQFSDIRYAHIHNVETFECAMTTNIILYYIVLYYMQPQQMII